jgi:hypothetical protein
VSATAPAPPAWLDASIAGLLPLALLAALCVYACRRAGLHWSWPALGLAAAVAEHGLLGDMFVPVALACAWAAASARHARRRALAAGGGAAARARAELTLVDALARGAAGLRARLTGGGAGRTAQARVAGGLLLGVDERGRHVWAPFAAGAPAGRHTLVVGATGSGKTVTLAHLLGGHIAAGAGAIVLDPKGDPALAAKLRTAAADAGRELAQWTPDGPLAYNPASSRSGRRTARWPTTRSGTGAPARSPTRPSRASASASRTTCARPSVTSDTPCAP